MSRAVAPLAGTLLLITATVVLAAVVGTAAIGSESAADPPPTVVLSLSASPDGQLELVHESGAPLDVRDLEMVVEIDGVPLEYQPPVPFFSAAGFRPGPTGPFNVASDPTWEVGERASLRLASTNSPNPTEGATVTIRITMGHSPVATIETTVRR